MRNAISILAAASFITGCIFPSFDNMQKGGASKNDDDTTEAAPTEGSVKNGLAADASTDASPVGVASSSPDAGADATPDVVEAPPPGAGKIACGSSECTAGSDNYCCAGYGAPSFSCKNDNSFLAGACSGGAAHALFCDEKADCPTGQVCCDQPDGIGTLAQCASTRGGGKVLCKTDKDCPTGKTCTGSLDSDVPNKVCQ
jgi:hypothetical protein